VELERLLSPFRDWPSSIKQQNVAINYSRSFLNGNFLDLLSQHNFIILYVNLSISVVDDPSDVERFVALGIIDVSLQRHVNRSTVATEVTALRCARVLTF